MSMMSEDGDDYYLTMTTPCHCPSLPAQLWNLELLEWLETSEALQWREVRGGKHSALEATTASPLVSVGAAGRYEMGVDIMILCLEFGVWSG